MSSVHTATTGTTVELLKALGDETRLRIVNLLEGEEELCACQIEGVLNVTQSNASRHLSRLREVGLVSVRRSRQWAFFSLVKDENTSLVRMIISHARRHIPQLNTDTERLAVEGKNAFFCTIPSFMEESV